MKKVFSILVILLLCFSLPMKASASTVSFDTVQPYYEKAYDAKSELLISGTTAVCESFVSGNSEVVEITATQYLQKQGFLWIWSTYDGAEWTKTVYSNILTMSNTKTGLTSGKYRLKTDFTLTDKNGKTEIITVYSAVAAVSMSALGVTAFADFGNFSFVLEGLHWDNYVAVSNGVKKSADWYVAPTASVTVTSGNVSLTNSAEMWIAADQHWPEVDIITDHSVNVTSHNNAKYILTYDTDSSHLSDVIDNKVYLVARTGYEDVWFGGTWTP